MEHTRMRILTAAAILAAFLVPAAPASAATGQCYDAYGRPVGGPFDTFNPNRAFIDSVIARGGNCTVVAAPGYPSAPGYQGAYPAPGYGYQYRDPSNDPGGRHSDWCSSNPPSGYCTVPESK
jgi:hypothetical protein